MKNNFKLVISSIILLCVLFPNCTSELENNKVDQKKLYSEMYDVLNSTMQKWYPLVIDTIYGGYFSDIDHKWEINGSQNKMIVSQARHVWSNSNASLFYKKKEPFFKTAKHGYQFLKNVMWDKTYGGFYNLVDRNGKPVKEDGKIIKQIYGNAFAIYGLAAYYNAFRDTSALNLAIETFNWVDKHSYDPKYGGYFQFLSREGKPFKNGYKNVPPKDQNSMIHIMESFVELYHVWPNTILEKRLQSIFLLIRDTVVGDKGYMTLFFENNWRLISYRDSIKEIRENNYLLDHISFGHAVETAYLLIEASNALGIENDTTTLKIAKHLDDFVLENGWDNEVGGIYDRGYIFKGDTYVTIISKNKGWWSQVEALNSFMMMAEYYPNDEHNYYNKFLRMWNYIKEYSIDHEYGGWYWEGIDMTPDIESHVKATIWKTTYHTSRGLINCLLRLQNN